MTPEQIGKLFRNFPADASTTRGTVALGLGSRSAALL